jgi:serine/threonine protein kinase
MSSRTATTRIGDRYELERRIARGGMGEVWAARDTRLARPVAIKFLRGDVAQPAARKRFQAEARAAGGLTHPNVVSVYDSGTHDDAPYLVMELLPGRTLSDEIRDGPLRDERVRDVALEILGALETAHRAGVVHRDVKPGNVLLTQEGRAKVADFGIAKAADVTATGSGEIVGSVPYMAPERFDGQTSERSDLYAVGAVLYEACTGRVPYPERSVWAVATAAREGAFPPVRELRPDTDPALSEAIERALSPDPEDRFASANEMAAAIRGEAAGSDETRRLTPTDTRPLPSEELPAPAPPRRRRPVRPSVLIAAVAILVVLVVAVVVGMLVRSPSPPPGGPVETEAGSVPAPLEDALDRLDEAVRP